MGAVLIQNLYQNVFPSWGKEAIMTSNTPKHNDDLARRISFLLDEQESLRNGTTRANARAEQAHNRIDDIDTRVDIIESGIGGLIDEARASTEVRRRVVALERGNYSNTARPTGRAWFFTILAGIIAWWIWASIDFTQTLASGDVINHVADRWWAAALFGLAVSVITIAAIPWRRHTVEADEAPTITEEIDTKAVVSGRRSHHV